MACKLKLNELEDCDKEYLQKTLTIENEGLFDVDDNDEYALIPFAFARKTFELNDDDDKSTTSVMEGIAETINFVGTLREDQRLVETLCMKRLLQEGDKSAIIASHPGFGKTITSIRIACELKVKTLIVVNKLILIKQWMESIVKYTDATETKIQYVKPTAIALDANASFYVVNAINICKKSEKFWSPIKFLIVDELHQIITKVLSKSLFRIVPRYVLGLSATPYRFDEYQQAIAWFFGSTIIGKDLYVRHTVYRLMTGFKPLKVKYTTKGVDWNSVLEEQSENDDRNELIVSTIIELNKRPTSCGRTWMILVKRVAHAETLVEKFAKYGVACTTLLRSAVEFDKSCKILIGTTSKIGVGFDHAAIDALCIAADVKNYFVQFLGRCMRRPDAYPIVLDLEDDFTSLKRHFDGRVSEYKKHGGRILPFV